MTILSFPDIRHADRRPAVGAKQPVVLTSRCLEAGNRGTARVRPAAVRPALSPAKVHRGHHVQKLISLGVVESVVDGQSARGTRTETAAAPGRTPRTRKPDWADRGELAGSNTAGGGLALSRGPRTRGRSQVSTSGCSNVQRARADRTARDGAARAHGGTPVRRWGQFLRTARRVAESPGGLTLSVGSIILTAGMSPLVFL
ncbi:hypothetical protein [Corynebacterium heidelbergense]|uniref:hypothetical protein n=1 Tax=Corynebacterium heidelbergense TaxID=2055947 RepID=UPI0011BD5EC6|nr:hypothetical protein [Corynebacterium heidelbergense]WCZ36684.1 hypothetical protein CHEID_05735 [Corynebacterium heidelbergense]